MPGWSRRVRIMIDWTFALLLRPDIVKISLDSESVSLFRGAAAGAFPENGRIEAVHRSGKPSPVDGAVPGVGLGGR